jgi:hypothetical protein
VTAKIESLVLIEADVAIWSEIFLEWDTTEMYTVQLTPYHVDFQGNVILMEGYEKIVLKHKLGRLGDLSDDSTKRSSQAEKNTQEIHQQRKSSDGNLVKHIPAPTDVAYLKYLSTTIDPFTSLNHPILCSKRTLTALTLALRANVIENFHSIDADKVKMENFSFPPTAIESVSPFKSDALLTEYYQENFGKTFITHGFLAFGEKSIPNDTIKANIQKFVEQKIVPLIKVFLMKELLLAKLSEEARDELQLKYVVQIMMAKQYLKKID